MLAHHPPAVKIGGRRLSITSKPKPALSLTQEPPVAVDLNSANSAESTTSDYPRPSAPTHQPEEETVVRDRQGKEKGKETGYNEYDKEAKRTVTVHEQKRQDDQLPFKNLNAQRKEHNSAKRISQPTGKWIDV